MADEGHRAGLRNSGEQHGGGRAAEFPVGSTKG